MARPANLKADVRSYIDLELGDALAYAESVVRDEATARASGPRAARVPSGMIVQTLILSKDSFRTMDAARRWVKSHGFKSGHRGKSPDETSSSFRFRQRDPGDFKKGSFRTFSMTTGVKAVAGRLKG